MNGVNSLRYSPFHYESNGYQVESIEQTFNGTVDFSRKVSCTVSRNGDLIWKTYLQLDLPHVAASTSNHQPSWVENIGHALIDYVNIEIGGQEINYQSLKA